MHDRRADPRPSPTPMVPEVPSLRQERAWKLGSMVRSMSIVPKPSVLRNPFLAFTRRHRAEIY